MSLAITGARTEEKDIDDYKNDRRYEVCFFSCFFIFRDIKKIESRPYVYVILVLTKMHRKFLIN